MECTSVESLHDQNLRIFLQAAVWRGSLLHRFRDRSTTALRSYASPNNHHQPKHNIGDPHQTKERSPEPHSPHPTFVSKRARYNVTRRRPNRHDRVTAVHDATGDFDPSSGNMVTLFEGCVGLADASVTGPKYEMDGEGKNGYGPADGKQ